MQAAESVDMMVAPSAGARPSTLIERLFSDCKTMAKKKDSRLNKTSRFELIDHTADTGLVASGKSLAEAFANAAYGMFSIMAEVESVTEAESRHVEVTADDIEMLLVEWLNELTYIFDAERLIFRRCEVQELQDQKLVAICYGEKYDRSRHGAKLGIKAATYHMLNVDRVNNRVRVVFDV